MVTDPFPNSADRTMEVRLATLFNAQNALILPNDPTDQRDGLVWFNTSDLKLKLYAGGKIWVIGSASVQI